VVINAHFSEARPVLNFSPDHVETGVSLDDTVTEAVTLKNSGLASLNGVQVGLVNADGSPAPAWVRLNSAAGLGDLAVGESRSVSIAFAPTATVAEGVYAFKLRVTAANYPQTDIHLYASVTQSGIGNVLFKVSDIYTGTLNAGGQVIQGLSGAKVRLQNEAVLTEEYNAVTDGIGEAYFTDIPSGRYKARVTASNHQEYIGRVWVKPGVTAVEDVFLDYNLVTVEWSVNEITIEDKYEILLTATYETNVPAAVVAVEPSSIRLPQMAAGDVYNGEVTLTNYGLIRAEDLDFKLPSSDSHFKFELLAARPQTLEAKERITIPYRVTCLKSLDQTEDGTGGGCYSYVRCMNVDYGYRCVNGVWSKGSVRHCWTYSYGACGGGSTPVTYTPGGTATISGGTGSGSYSSPAPAPRSIEGVKCFPQPSLKERFFGWFTSAKETLRNWAQKVGCEVNTVTRQFTDEEVDLSVKVPGGVIQVQRRYYADRWQWEHLRNDLKFQYDAIGEAVASIDKGGVIYKPLSGDGAVFVSETFQIARTDSGFRWSDKYGNWKAYDADGRLAEYGTRNGTVCKTLFESGENGRLIGLADRNDRQVIWYEYDGSNRISAVQDADNRRVQYSHSGDWLTTVTDVLGQSTTFQYDTEGRITRKTDAAGRPTIVQYDDYGNVKSVVDGSGVGHFFEFDYDSGKKETFARITTSAGRIKEVWYDKDGETRRVDINGRTVQSIAKDGRNLIITDEKGKVTRKEYDEWDNLTRIVYPDGSSVSFEYEQTYNKPTRLVDPRGIITEFQYDQRGNLIRKIEAAGTEAERVTAFSYDTFGQLLSATVEADARTLETTTAFAYDGDGNVASITDPENNTTEFLEYDAMGNLLRMVDPRGYEWRFDYDDLGRLVSQTDALQSTTAYEYDGANNRTAIINAFLKRFEFVYDDHNNLIKSVDPYQKFVTVDYNTDNLPTRAVDQEGKVSRTQYDNEGRILKEIDGAGNQVVYTQCR
jgi:YD repeat-containing protein